MKNIAIIGAGWLGLPLAHQLLSQGESVYATRTTPQRLVELETQIVPCFQLSLDSQNDQANFVTVNALIKRDIKTVIGTFPPGFRHGEGEAYAMRWKSLIASSIKAGVEKIIMVSSTTVYPDINTNMVEDDASLSLAENNIHFTDNARTMLKAEQALIDSGIEYVVLRCSGLFGPQRHPARFISKLSTISTVAPVNMIHQKDIIKLLCFSLNNIHNQTLNVTCPTTVSKFEFYKQAALCYDSELILPKLDTKESKKIVADKLVKTGFQFHYSHVLDGLKHC